MVVPIRDGRIHFLGQSLAEVSAGLYAKIAARHGARVPALSDVASVPGVPAEVNHGRWIVVCPDCGGAEYVWFEMPQMWCASCLNGAVGGKWRPVALPGNKAEIERILLARPLPQQRNWKRETPAELRAENRAHGHPEEG